MKRPLPATLNFAFLSGLAQERRDAAMTRARSSGGEGRSQWAQNARGWHRIMLRNAGHARFFYENDLRSVARGSDPEMIGK